MIDYNKFKEVRELLREEVRNAESEKQERDCWEALRAFENAYPEHTRNYFKSLGASSCI